MLELEEFARAVRCLAQRHDPRVADEGAKRLEIREAVARLRGGERDRRRSNPLDDGAHRMFHASRPLRRTSAPLPTYANVAKLRPVPVPAGVR